MFQKFSICKHKSLICADNKESLCAITKAVRFRFALNASSALNSGLGCINSTRRFDQGQNGGIFKNYTSDSKSPYLTIREFDALFANPSFITFRETENLVMDCCGSTCC